MFTRIPTFPEWKSKSGSGSIFTSRGQDKVLLRIDELVKEYGRTNNGPESAYFLGEIYFATNYWLRNIGRVRGTGMHKGRTDAIRQLLRCAVRLLSKTFQCSVQALPNELEWMYGRSQSTHGISMPGQNLKRHVSENYKVHFKKGVAWHFNTDTGLDQVKLVRASTSSKHVKSDFNPGTRMNSRSSYKFCVLSMSRDLYMGGHFKRTMMGGLTETRAQFHTSWLAGLPVQCAGSIKIIDGNVKAICSDSGHYKPTDDHLINFLEMLKMVGVDIAEVEVYDYSFSLLGLGNVVLANRGNLATLIDRARGLNVAPLGPSASEGVIKEREHRLREQKNYVPYQRQQQEQYRRRNS